MNDNPFEKGVGANEAASAAAAELRGADILSKEEKLAKKRAMREGKSMEGFDNPFDIPEEMMDPDYHYFIALDKPGRINSFIGMGYEMVVDAKIAAHLNLKEEEPIKFASGHPKYEWMYLLRIELELFHEDQAKHNALAQEKWTTSLRQRKAYPSRKMRRCPASI